MNSCKHNLYVTLSRQIIIFSKENCKEELDTRCSLNFRRKSYQNTISNAPFISYRQTFRYNLWSYQVEFQTAKKLSMQLIEIQCKLWEHFNWYNVKRQAKLLRPCPPNFPLNEKKNILTIWKGRQNKCPTFSKRVKVHWWKYKYRVHILNRYW